MTCPPMEATTRCGLASTVMGWSTPGVRTCLAVMVLTPRSRFVPLHDEGAELAAAKPLRLFDNHLSISTVPPAQWHHGRNGTTEERKPHHDRARSDTRAGPD